MDPLENARPRTSCLHKKVRLRATIVCNGPLKPNMVTPFGLGKSSVPQNRSMLFDRCPPEIKERFRDATLLQIHDDGRLKLYEDAFAFLPWSNCPAELRQKLSSRELEYGDEVVLSAVVEEFIDPDSGYTLFRPIALLSVQKWEAGAVRPRPKLPDSNSLKALAIVRGSTLFVVTGGLPPPKKPAESPLATDD